MKIQKFKNGNINLKCTDERDVYEIMMSDDLEWSDLTIFTSTEDGWMYMYDANQDNLYSMNDYGYDNIRELLNGRTVKMVPMEMDECAREIVEAMFG